MTFINWLKRFFTRKYPIIPGSLGITQNDIDNHAPSASVYIHKEVVASVAMPTFKGIRGDGTVRKFPYQFQAQSSACVAFTTAKIATILYFLLTGRIVKWSPGFWYTQRINKPAEGMGFDDITKLATLGAVTNEVLPSEGIGESEMNSLDLQDYIKNAADGFAISPYWIEVPLDFDTVASTIEVTKKPLMIWFSFGSGEWFYQTYPKIVSDNKPWNHSVTAVDTTTINGIPYIVIEDSADHEENRVKYISREFFARCILARYTMQFKFLDMPNKPKFDGTIRSLQQCLIYEKLLASGLDTNFFGELTKAALIKFQLKYGIVPAQGVFGPMTKNKLSELFN